VSPSSSPKTETVSFSDTYVSTNKSNGIATQKANSLIHSFIFLSFPTWNIGPLSGFLDHTHTIGHTVGLSGRVISPWKRPLPTRYNTTYKHKRQASMPRAGFEPVTPATKWPQTYALDPAATGMTQQPYGLNNYDH
jgi:hypothetical protein